MHRLHIDIPLDCDLETAKRIGLAVVNAILAERAQLQSELFVMSLDPIQERDILECKSNLREIKQLNYRLGSDEDRQRSNYYIMDSRGHVTHKKCVIDFGEDGVPQPRMV